MHSNNSRTAVMPAAVHRAAAERGGQSAPFGRKWNSMVRKLTMIVFSPWRQAAWLRMD